MLKGFFIVVDFNQLREENAPLLTFEELNRSPYVKAEEIFEQGRLFSVVGVVTTTKMVTFAGQKEPSRISELNIRFPDGTEGILSLGYNARHENFVHYFQQYPNGRTELLQLAKGEARQKNMNAPWIFVKGGEQE